MTRPRALVSWSSGKDSAYALYVARTTGLADVVGLLTTLTSGYRRVSMHGVREAVLDRQAQAAGLPLHKVFIPPVCTNDAYEREMAAAMAAARDRGVTHVIFGDLFLADVRAYRETMLARAGIAGMFPLWQRPTAALAREMLADGMSAVITCVDPRRVDRSCAGRRWDVSLLEALPSSADPCAENGEFHTCVTAGPMFDAPLSVTVGEVVERDGFVFADLECIAAAEVATNA
jgi:uncharacterized protein (TIGR00290 family)